MSAELDTKGLKRVCAECGTRFYDFNKRPIICPGCKEEFTGEQKVKVRRGRNAIVPDPAKEDAKKKDIAKAKEESQEDVIDDNDSEEDVISLDDLDHDDDDLDHDDDDKVIPDPDLDELDSSIDDDDLDHDDDEDIDELKD